jgi:hypothetical protein
MRRDLLQPVPTGEARLLLLIDAFSDQPPGLEGRTKLAKLDFLLRYPAFFRRAVARRAPAVVPPADEEPEDDLIETPMSASATVHGILRTSRYSVALSVGDWCCLFQPQRASVTKPQPRGRSSRSGWRIPQPGPPSRGAPDCFAATST